MPHNRFRFVMQHLYVRFNALIAEDFSDLDGRTQPIYRDVMDFQIFWRNTSCRHNRIFPIHHNIHFFQNILMVCSEIVNTHGPDLFAAFSMVISSLFRIFTPSTATIISPACRDGWSKKFSKSRIGAPV